MGGAVSAGLDHDDLIDNLLDGNCIKSERVQKVFRCVDRAMYYLPEHRSSAYRDSAWKEGNLHLSAPCIYAEVMESLDIRPGMSFLNVGSGTGYVSTMVGLLLGAEGVNHGVEVHESNVKYAGERLCEFMKTSIAIRYYDFAIPKFVVGNGLRLSLDHAGQYDRIYVGSACSTPERLRFLGQFLKIGGIMVAPCGDELLKMTRNSTDTYSQVAVMQCSFATLIGPEADSMEVQLPARSAVPLRFACRAVVMRSIRNRILSEHPELAMPRTHAKHGDRPRRQHRIVFPLLIAQNDDDDEPQIVLGNPIQSHDNGNDAPNDLLSEDDEPRAGAQGPGLNDFFDDDGSSARLPSPVRHDPTGNVPSSSSAFYVENGDRGGALTEIAESAVDEESDSLMTDDDDGSGGNSADQLPASSSGPFSPGTRRLFRKRRLSSARLSSSEPTSASAPEDGPKRRSVLQLTMQPPSLSATVSVTNGSVTVSDLEVSSPSSSAPSSSSSGQNPSDPPNRSTGSRTVRIRAITSARNSSADVELSASEPSSSSSSTESAVEQTASIMERLTRDAAKSLFYPPVTKRFLNCDRPLD